MKTVDDINCEGGPAFPSLNPVGSLADPFGMSLRDWFAGQALKGVLSDREQALAVIFDRPKGMEPIPAIATVAYAYADAMLSARKGGVA